MSVIRPRRLLPKGSYDGEKVVLPRTDQLWTILEREWAGDDPLRWKQLAALHLYCHCRWTCEMIGHAWSHPRGHVSRMLRQTVSQLREIFTLELPDPHGALNGCLADDAEAVANSRADCVTPDPADCKRPTATAR